MFNDYVGKIKPVLGEEGTANIVLKSIYVVCVGSNDISNTYPIRSSQYDINSYTDLLINSATSFFKELYGLGARRIAILSLPPIGCLPSQRTLTGGPNRQCNEFTNQAAMLFNSKLSSTIDSLNQVLPDARLAFGDIYNPLLSLIQNPAKYGFEVATKGCCGTGNIEVSVFCNRLEDTYTCKDASKYIFWDSFHPTEKAYKTLVPIVLKQALNKLF
uniref:GDSL esterase/lipase EXL3-like n=1 Tax=Rhizophora mucronata TaxID=61149 RepID=A0A2P2QQ39_RHIMU